MITDSETIWLGSRRLAEQADSPAWQFSPEKTTCTRIYRAPYDVALSQRPTLSATMPDLDASLAIEGVQLTKKAGGIGEMIVTLGTIPFAGFPGSGQPEPVYEIEWTQIQKRIEQHPKFSDIDRALLAKIEDALSERDDAKRDALLAEIAADEKAILLYEKKLKGVDSYLIFAPVARRTSYTRLKPNTGGCGQVGAPPGAIGAPSGYEWLKTADRCIKQGRWWERVEEWTGAEDVDDDLYPVNG